MPPRPDRFRCRPAPYVPDYSAPGTCGVPRVEREGASVIVKLPRKAAFVLTALQARTLALDLQDAADLADPPPEYPKGTQIKDGAE